MTQISCRNWGLLANGQMAQLFTLQNKNGLSLEVSDWGGVIRTLLVPDKKGDLANIVLGYETPQAYENDPCYFGAMVGRYANRIKGGCFTLNGTSYQLTQNEGQNHLHGGMASLCRKQWDAKLEADALLLSLTSPAGEEGYPGTLAVTIRITLSEENELSLEYGAKSDQDTIINLTNHSYFNLAGQGDILGHYLYLRSHQYLPVNSELIPLGLVAEAKGAFDFSSLRQIAAGWYDHNYIFTKGDGPAALLWDAESGRAMEVFTDLPGVQLYTGASIPAGLCGIGSAIYGPYHGLCLETQYFPNTPNEPDYPSCVLRAGALWQSKTVFHFFTR